MPDGLNADFDLKKESRAVCVLALTLDQRVILTKQFRPGLSKILMELPGGTANKNETPGQAIKRELLEETGYTGKFKFVTTSYNCGYSSRVKYNFVASDCKKIQKAKTDKHEFIEVNLMNLKNFKKHLAGGQLTDVETGYLGLNFLKLL